MHPTLPESTKNWVITHNTGWDICVCSCRTPFLPFPVNVVSYEMLTGMFLYARPVHCMLFFLTVTLALSFNYPDVVILGKAALSIMVCLPSKQSLLPPYLCELIKISSSNCSLPLFSISSPSQFTSLSLFSTLLSTLTPTLSPLWNNKLFPLSFPLTEDVFGPIPKRLWHQIILMPFCVSTGLLSKGVSLAWNPRPSHQLRSGSVNHVSHLPAFPKSHSCGDRTDETCSLCNRLLFSDHFQKVCLRYEKPRLFCIGVKRQLDEGRECWASNICPAKICFSIYRINILSNHFLYIIGQSRSIFDSCIQAEEKNKLVKTLPKIKCFLF